MLRPDALLSPNSLWRARLRNVFLHSLQALILRRELTFEKVQRCFALEGLRRGEAVQQSRLRIRSVMPRRSQSERHGQATKFSAFKVLVE